MLRRPRLARDGCHGGRFVRRNATVAKEGDFSNQQMAIEPGLLDKLRLLLWKFRAVRYAVAYGSGVFPQRRKEEGAVPMVDLIFGVTFTQHWHSLNLHSHADHYSSLAQLGSGMVSRVQDGLGAGVYFNTYVEMDGLRLKYGVVNIDTLSRDLAEWDTLYLAGRLHKPVKILRDDHTVRQASQRNLLSAMRVALLLLPETFSERQLYETIAGLSYMGDVRMKIAGENPHKVQNIVMAQEEHFRRLYAPLVHTLPNLTYKEKGDVGASAMQQDMDPVRRGNMVARLPTQFQSKLYNVYGRRPHFDASDERPPGGDVERMISADPALRKNVQKAIRSTVFWPSAMQTVKGVLTAGPVKATSYAAEKFTKWYRS